MVMEDVYLIERLLVEAGFDGYVPNKESMLAMEHALIRAPIDYLIDAKKPVHLDWKSKFTDTHSTKLLKAFDANRLPIVEEQQPELEGSRLKAGFQLLAMRDLA